jgi:dUTP pyrophosphatase
VREPREIRVKRLHPDAVLPERRHAGDAGFDLVSVEAVTLDPAGGRATVATGIAVEIPDGWTGLVCPRSGLAAKHGIGVVNGPGVVDAGYRGEVKVILVNSDPYDEFEIQPGDRIAQLVVTPVLTVPVVEVDELSSADRSSAGFGSTGGFGF